jgi:5-methylcytosine-specific restriction enzyme subunit McrC
VVGSRTVHLFEWQSLPPDPGSPTHGWFPPPDPRAKALVQALARDGALDIQELRGGAALRASSFVGCISIGELRIVIEPKIRGMRLLQLLRYAYGLRDLRLLTRADSAVEETSFQDLLIHQLLVEAREILSRGIHLRYVPAKARLGSPRGRVDFQALARNNIAAASLPCHYHPKLEDCLLNQVLLFGLRFAIWLTQDRDLKSDLRHTAQLLEDSVSTISVDWPVLGRLRREMNRLTVAYEPAVAIIELLLSAAGTSLDGGARSANLPGFLFDMNRFFQRLLGRFLRDNLPDHEVKEESSLTGMMAYSAGQNPKGRRPPTPRPDFCVRGNGGTHLLDAKYRDLWEQNLPRDMLYQLAIYALSQKPVGRAAILYPTLNEKAMDAAIEIREPSSGARRAEVLLRPVNLALMAELLSAPISAVAVRQRREFASRMVGIAY